MMETTTSQGKKSLTALVILALVGIALSIELTQHYYALRSGLAGFHSFCDISKTMNCDAVAASSFSELGAGLPLSSFGAGWYLALLVVALIARHRFWRRDALRVAALMTSFGLLLSLSYLAIMAFRIKTYCIFCLGLDATALFSWLAVLSAKPELSWKRQKPDPAKWRLIAASTFACLAVAVFALQSFDSVSIPISKIDDLVNEVVQSPVLPVETGAAEPSLGPLNAPVTIAEFSDFQCPYCRIGAMVMNALMERYPSRIRLVFKPFPLDASCNRMITQPMHLAACEAARTALCAQRQGKFQPVYETLFENQTSILPGRPAVMAAQVGVNADQLASCVKEPGISQTVAKSIEEGIELGVQSTPTFFVNGHKVEGFLPTPFWNRLIPRMLREAPASTLSDAH